MKMDVLALHKSKCVRKLCTYIIHSLYSSVQGLRGRIYGL